MSCGLEQCQGAEEWVVEAEELHRERETLLCSVAAMAASLLPAHS